MQWIIVSLKALGRNIDQVESYEYNFGRILYLTLLFRYIFQNKTKQNMIVGIRVDRFKH